MENYNKWVARLSELIQKFRFGGELKSLWVKQLKTDQGEITTFDLGKNYLIKLEWRMMTNWKPKQIVEWASIVENERILVIYGTSPSIAILPMYDSFLDDICDNITKRRADEIIGYIITFMNAVNACEEWLDKLYVIPLQCLWWIEQARGWNKKLINLTGQDYFKDTFEKSHPKVYKILAPGKKTGHEEIDAIDTGTFMAFGAFEVPEVIDRSIIDRINGINPTI